MRLITNLLRDNSSNQSLFVEMECIGRLPSLLQAPTVTAAQHPDRFRSVTVSCATHHTMNALTQPRCVDRCVQLTNGHPALHC